MNPLYLGTLFIIISVIFNAGGFVWLARNHFNSVNKRLDAIETRLRDIELAIAGACRASALHGGKHG